MQLAGWQLPSRQKHSCRPYSEEHKKNMGMLLKFMF